VLEKSQLSFGDMDVSLQDILKSSAGRPPCISSPQDGWRYDSTATPVSRYGTSELTVTNVSNDVPTMSFNASEVIGANTNSG